MANYSLIWKSEGITPAEKLYNYILKNGKKHEATITDMGEGMSAVHLDDYDLSSMLRNLLLNNNTRQAKFPKSVISWPQGEKLVIPDGIDRWRADPGNFWIVFDRIRYWGTFDNGLAVIGSRNAGDARFYGVIDKEFNLIIPFRVLKVDGEFANVDEPTPEHVQQLLDEARATQTGK